MNSIGNQGNHCGAPKQKRAPGPATQAMVTPKKNRQKENKFFFIYQLHTMKRPKKRTAEPKLKE